MKDRIRFYLNRMRERLWVKPLAICLLSIAAAILARMADHLAIADAVPEISSESIETLLTTLAASMLVIAVFTVGSMLSAYASASSAATPRSFSLVIADDVSQNALSTFIGAFIFSIVGLVALLNGYYQMAGRFALFLITVTVFAIVIVNFLRWVDRIARLGRLGNTVDRIEAVTARALARRRRAPTPEALSLRGREEGIAVRAAAVGYVQSIDIATLQAVGENHDLHIAVASLPGTFATRETALAFVHGKKSGALEDPERSEIVRAFLIGDERTFDEDPRFGLIVLSEIAIRALSPAVNDPGTAIDVIGTLVRLFTSWAETREENGQPPVEFDRVALPEISIDDMFDDAFNPIARDGAPIIEVGIRLQKALQALAALDDGPIRGAAVRHSQHALRYAEQALKLPEEIELLQKAAVSTSSCYEQRN